MKPLHHEKNIKQFGEWTYFRAVFKAVVCIVMQYFGTILLLQQAFREKKKYIKNFHTPKKITFFFWLMTLFFFMCS